MNSISDVWQSVLSRLQEQLSETTIRTWFDEVDVVTMEDSAFVLHCSNSFKKSTIETRFMKHIKAALKDIFSSDLEVKILNDEQLAAYHGVAPDQPGSLLDSDAFTFETYVVGPQNKLAYAAARAVADKPAENFNPLFIYGDSGLGKTHLLYAIAHQVKRKREDLRIVYIKGDDFTNDMVHSIQTHTQSEFREKYRTADLLLMDDIQFSAGKQQTQEEWFHTFNALYESHKAIVLTSDRPPMEMKTLEDRIRSRLEGGMLADVQPPDLETRMAITRNKAQLLGMVLPGDVVEFIAENITSNIRQLEGVVKRLTAYREILGEEITVESVRRAIKDVIRVGAYVPTADIIITETARYFGLEEEHLRGQSRAKEVATPRQVAMYLCRNLTNISLEDIGAQFGNRNHSTVLSSIRKIEKLVKTDSNTANIIRDITSNINSKS